MGFLNTSIKIKGFSCTSESVLVIEPHWSEQESTKSFLSSLNNSVFDTNRSINSLSVDNHSLQLEFDANDFVNILLDNRSLIGIRDAIVTSGCKFLLITRSRNKFTLVGYDHDKFFTMKFSSKKVTMRKVKCKRVQKILNRKLSKFLPYIDVEDEFSEHLGNITYSEIFNLCELLNSQRRTNG